MDPTKKLYDVDAYRTQFRATVLCCEPCTDGRFRVALDETAFYPEGGGQPSDRGALGSSRVLDVQEDGGVIWHTVTSPLRCGETVQGDLDWNRRFDHMQQHTGEHMVSGLIHDLFGFENVGFHIGTHEVTADYSGALTTENVDSLQHACDWLVWRDMMVCADYPSPGELQTLSYRSKKAIEGPLRIVQIDRVDTCACCGTHVRRTGELGRVRITGAQSYKGGTRLTLACGQRAARDYDEKSAALREVSALLCASPGQTGDAVRRLLDETAALKRRQAELENKLFSAYAREGRRLVVEEGLSPDSLRRLCLSLCGDSGIVCAALCPDSAQEGSCRYVLASSGQDVRPLCRLLNDRFCGRGGGSAGLCQGSVMARPEELQDFFEKQSAL